MNVYVGKAGEVAEALSHDGGPVGWGRAPVNGAIKAKAKARARREAGIAAAGEKLPDGTIEISRAHKVQMGIIPVSDLDDEELARKQVRSVNGDFSGSKKYRHTPAIYAEMDAELHLRGEQILRANYTRAVRKLVEFLDHSDGKIAVQAIDRVMERVTGKVPDKLITADVTPHAQVRAEIAEYLAAELGLDAVEGTPDYGPLAELDGPADGEGGEGAS